MPIFKSITHLPPFVGILLVLGVLWTVTEVFYRNLHRVGDKGGMQKRVTNMLSRIDMGTILFFLGILMAVACLETIGVLEMLGEGLKLVAQRNIAITSIGIDTWGVDFVCVGKDGALLRNPLAYRDPHTFGMMEDYFEKAVDKKTVYDITGIQFMNFNSLFQLYAMRKNNDTALEHAEKILFVPDALSYMLTGKMVCEYTTRLQI